MPCPFHADPRTQATAWGAARLARLTTHVRAALVWSQLLSKESLRERTQSLKAGLTRGDATWVNDRDKLTLDLVRMCAQPLPPRTAPRTPPSRALKPFRTTP